MKFGLFGSAQAKRGGPDMDSGQGFRDFIEYNVEAEALGYASTFAVEHHFTGFGQVSATLSLLTDTMRAYHDKAIAPYQSTLGSAADHDRRLRAQAMLDGGVHGLLASFQPMMSYSDGELRIPLHPDQVIHLEGRGLTLVPSYFCLRHPMTLFDAELPPVLVYNLVLLSGFAVSGAGMALLVRSLTQSNGAGGTTFAYIGSLSVSSRNRSAVPGSTRSVA